MRASPSQNVCCCIPELAQQRCCVRQSHGFSRSRLIVVWQVSKAILGDYVQAMKKGRPIPGKGSEHLTGPRPVVSTSTNRSIIRDPNFLVRLRSITHRSPPGPLAVGSISFSELLGGSMCSVS